MYIGGSLFLLAVGAILAFAVQDAISGVDLTMVGYILMGVAVLGFLFSFFLLGQQRSRGDGTAPPRGY
jgi:high-affinity nickel permease